MSATTNTTTPTIAVELIDVEEGFNPRRRFDHAGLEELARSIRSSGMVQPIRIREGSEGRYVLAAGERRLRAAQLAGLAEVPVIVHTEPSGELAAAVVQNLIREGLDPIEEAGALQRLAEAEGLTQKKLAARIGKSPTFVAERLRLLKLPAACQAHLADAELPLAVEKSLRLVAERSPLAAEMLAAYAVAEGLGDELVADVGTVLWQCMHRAADDGQVVPLIDVSMYRLGFDVVDDVQALAERYEQALVRLGRSWQLDRGVLDIRIGSEAIDAARAAGCLLEIEAVNEYRGSYEFLSDREFAADLIARQVEALEAEASAHLAAVAASAEKEGAEAPPDPASHSAEDRAATAKEAAKAEREEAKNAAARACGRNENLGIELLSRHGGQSRKKHSLGRAKLIARLLVAQNRDLAGAGLRYVMPALVTVEKTTLKSGQERTKLVYAEAVDCEAYLLRRIEAAKSAPEVLELVVDALIAAEWADEAAIARSNRIRWSAPASASVAAALKDEAKEVGAKGKPRSHTGF